MEIEIPDEGGYADLTMGRNSDSTIMVDTAEPSQIRLSIKSRSSHGEMRLGVGLSSDQARNLGEYLMSQATIVDEDCADED